MTKAEREAYNRRLKVLRDNYAAEEFAREKAAREREEFAREREAKALRQTAAKMLAEGVEPDVVKRCTGLTVEEIKALS